MNSKNLCVSFVLALASGISAAGSATITASAALKAAPELPASAEAVVKQARAGQAQFEALKADIEKAVTQLTIAEQQRVMSGTGYEMSSQDPQQAQAEAEAMGKKFQNMSQAEQIAAAMQMQGQVNSNMGLGATSVTGNDSEVLIQLNQDREQSYPVIQQRTALVQREEQIEQAANAEHQRIDAAFSAEQEKQSQNPGPCSPATLKRQRQQELDNAGRHIAAADKELVQLRALYADYRKLTAAEIARDDRMTAAHAKMKNPMLKKQNASFVSAQHQYAYGDVRGVLGIYANGIEAAEPWVRRREELAQQPLGGCGEGG